MGASQGGTGDGPAVDQQQDDGSDDASGKSKLLKVGIKAAAGALSGLNQPQQQQMAAGPQLGQGVNQPQATDPYQAYLLKLQQQNQTPFYGN